MASTLGPTPGNLQKLFDGTGCPGCNCEDDSKVWTTDLGHGAFIRTCSVCGWTTGMDDSVNLCDLGENWEFEPCDADPCPGVNDHYPIYIGSSKTGLMNSKCLKCDKKGTMFYTGKDTDAEIHEAIFGAIMKNLSEETVKVKDLEAISEMLREEIAAEDVDETPYVCDCGNNEKDCFEKTFDTSGNLVRMRCFNCDARLSSELDSGCDSNIICEKCENNCEDFFERTCDFGKLVQVKCFNCDSVVKFFRPRQKTFENTDYIHRDRVTEWNMIERGNHISWQRDFSYEHHAIVLSVDPNEQKLQVIEYGSHCDSIDGMLKFACVQEREEKIRSLKEIFLYRYDYDPENCYAPEEVIERAKSRVGERKYNVFTGNCEHFATWCKTGKAYCSQILPFLQRANVSSIVSFINQLTKPVMDLIKEKVFQYIISGAVVDDVAEFASKQLTLLRMTNLGRVGLTVLVNLIVELAVLYYNYKKLQDEIQNGRITNTEFRKRLFELVGETIGGLLLGLLLGFSWLLIGISFPAMIVTLILNIGGIVAGRFLGSWIGRKLHNRSSEALTE